MKDDKRKRIKRITLIIEAVVGVVIAVIGWNINIDYYSSLIFASGVGLASSAVSQIIRIIYWSSPKHEQEYEARKQEAHINAVDERRQHIREKTGYVTLQITAVSLVLLSVILAWLHAESWVILLIFFIFLFQCVVWTIVFHRMEKRM